MKKCCVCTLMWLFCGLAVRAQEDKRLVERLDSVMHFTEVSDFERLMDFTYPKLFSLVSRNDMMESLKSGMDNEDYATTMDSIRRVKVFPVFQDGSGKFAKVIHTMRMNMRFKEVLDSTELDDVLAMMKAGMGSANITFSKATNTLSISLLATMVAIKDELSPEWTFVTFENDEDDQELGRLLFSESVLTKLKTYQ